MNRIVIIYHFFPHYRKGVIEALQAEPEEIFFIGDPDGAAIGGGINTYQFKDGFFPVAFKLLLGNKYWLGGLYRILKRLEPDTIVFLGDMNSLAAWLIAPLLRMQGKRIVFWAHGWIDENEPTMKGLLRKLFFRIPNCLMLYGRRARRIATEKGFDPAKIYVVYNSLDYAEQRPLRISINRSGGIAYVKDRFPALDLARPLILCCARLTKIKRFSEVIHALAMFPADIRPTILFVGDGPEAQILEKLANKLNVSVYFYGACYDESELAACFLSADVVVSPGNVGLTAMHSLAYGIPVITHNNRNTQMPEVEAVIEGITGKFFEENCSESLKSAIDELVFDVARQNFDRAACISMVEKFFNPDYQVKKIMMCLRGIAESESITDIISAEDLTSTGIK